MQETKETRVPSLCQEDAQEEAMATHSRILMEGERLCKAGDFKAGVAFFEAAVQVGTEDLKTLSAIYMEPSPLVPGSVHRG